MNTRLSKSQGIASLFILLSILVNAQSICAQWKIVAPVAGSHASLYARNGVLWTIGASVLFSFDTGRSWQSLPYNLPYSVIDMAFFDTNNGVFGTVGSVYLTSDGGRNWNSILTDPLGSSIHAVMYGNTSSDIYALDARGLLFITTNSGKSWNTVGLVGTAFQVGSFSLTTAPDGVLYALSAGWAQSSTDEGVSWTLKGYTDGDSYTIIADSCTDYRLYVANENWVLPSDQFSRIFVSSDQGATWQVAFKDHLGVIAGCMSASHCAIYAGTMDSLGILRSTDRGLSWWRIGGPTQYADTRNLVAIDDDVVFVTDRMGNIWGTYNGGGYPLHAQVNCDFADGSKRISMKAGDTINVYYKIPGVAGSTLDTMHLVVRYNNALTLKHVQISADWSILDSSMKNGILDLWLVANAQQVPSELLTLNFGTVLDAQWAKVYLDSNHLYVPTLDCGCTALSIPAPDSVEIDFTGCGDSTILAAMQHTPPFTIESIVPNPAQTEVTVTVSGIREPESGVSYQLFDALGNCVLSQHASAASLQMDVANLPSGIYFLRVSGNGYAQSRSVAIER